MTWGEIKLKCLQLMFSNEPATLSVDDNNQEYIYAMPGVANDALSQVTAVGVPIRRKYTIEISSAAEEALQENDKLTLPVLSDSAYKIPLNEYCADFRAVDPGQIYAEKNGSYGRMEDWKIEGDDVFVFDGREEETITLYYRRYPAAITVETEDSTDLGVPREVAEIIPLYMAGELYKDDDLSMATVFRNEFEDALQKLQYTAKGRAKAASGASFGNTKGWY